MVEYQNADLPNDPHAAAGEVMTRIEEAVKEASGRFNATVAHHGTRRVSLETAFESLKEMEQTAAWATRMLIEITGRYRREHGRASNTLSMRDMSSVSGVSLASIHSWVNHPAQVLEDGRTGPGTLPRPGQTSHRFTQGPGYFAQPAGQQIDLDEFLSTGYTEEHDRAHGS